MEYFSEEENKKVLNSRVQEKKELIKDEEELKELETLYQVLQRSEKDY